MPESQKDKVEQTEKKEWAFPFSEQDWAATPEAVRNFLVSLVTSHAAIEKRVEELEKRLNKNSTNSSKPPSSDDPYKEKPKKNKKGEKVTNRKCSIPQKLKISSLKPAFVEIPSLKTRRLIIPIKSLNCPKSKWRLLILFSIRASAPAVER
jgi:hypothetical protein